MKRKIRDAAMWFLMFCKRLLYKPGFTVLLLIIPITVTAMKLSVSDGSAVLRIGLYCEDTQVGEEIVNKLLEKDSIVSFERCNSEQEAREAVLTEKIQGAWIFPSELEETIERNARVGSLKPLCKVIEREDTIPLKLSHEILYGSLHEYVAYDNYRMFIQKKYGEEIDPNEEEMRKIYEKNDLFSEIIRIEKAGTEKKAEIDTNFLVFPLRGILAILMVLCGLASVMFFQDDRKNGKFDRMPSLRHIIPAFGSCFAGICLSAIPVFISVLFLNLGANIFFEILALILYSLCICGFCLIIWQLTGSASRLGALTPFIIIIMLVLCPVFLDFGIELNVILPPTHYLYAPYDLKYMLHLLIYAAVSFAIAFILNLFVNGTLHRTSK